MTHNEYEQRKRRLDEQLRVGIEWLQTAHRQQVEALNLLWTNDSEVDADRPAAEPTPAVFPPILDQPQAPGRPRRRAWELYREVQGVLAKVPEVFDRNHVCEQLGYEPDRGSLHRTLEQLTDEGILARESWGVGRTPTRYRKAGNAGRSGAET
ncbi:MAG TPA: hypothetical protein VGX68_26850 [Thermoanaerobaculia bacterium]|jgi:hypothetical protein|nr:hypothetical protein [Thermoanaerobaculia bacterium]